MSARRAILLAGLLFLFWTTGLATENGYVIGSGDVLQITVYDEPDLERTVTVQQDGSIRFPLIKIFQLGGRTVPQAEQALEEALQAYLVDPQVTITIKEHRAQMVYVLGAVAKPGAYALTGSTTVLEVISQAGGITPEGSRRFLLLRGGGNPAHVSQLLEQSGNGDREQALREAGIQPPIVIDGHRLLDEGDTTQNVILQAGDVIYVPKMRLVYVLGEVRRPGGVPYTEGLTLLQAISLAGGTTEMASNTIEVTRKVSGQEKRFKLNYKSVLRDTSLDLPLEPDDVIVVKRRIL